MSATTIKCCVCKTRDINPMIGSIEPRTAINNVLLGNKSYCSRLCFNLKHTLHNQFIDDDTLARIADNLHRGILT